MNQAGVQNGDLLVVDRAEKHNTGTSLSLRSTVSSPSNDCVAPTPGTGAGFRQPGIPHTDPENICIFGVVTHVIHRTREYADVCTG